MPIPDATTTGGSLLVLSIVVPVAGVLLAFLLGERYVRPIALIALPPGLAIAAAVLVLLPQGNGHLVYLLGGWTPPLGVALRADGLSAVMLAITAVVISGVAIFATADFRAADGAARAPFAFWVLLLAIWGALNTIFVAGDMFTLYVALELLTFAAVPLVSLDGRPETLQAAIRYLLFALLGSVLYLLGTALLYGRYGTLDIVLLSQRVASDPATIVAAALMTTGLLAKTALVPAASLAAASPRWRAGGSQRDPVGSRREGIVLHRRAALVSGDAGHCPVLPPRNCSPRSARRRSCSGASSRCARRG